MVSIETVRQLALSFPETDEHPHFERKAFRVKKKIFATLSEKDMTVSLKLTLHDQSVFCAFDKSVIYFIGPINQLGKRIGARYIITVTNYLKRWAKAQPGKDCSA